MITHQHLRDAARVLESGNEEGAQRHLRAAIGSMTPQTLLRHGVLDDTGHIQAKQAMSGVHRHLLLVKDIVDVAAKNQAAIRRDSYGDYESGPSLPRADPNAGYGPGALAQKPTQRQPGGDRALNAPDRTNSGGSDPAVADPVGPQPKGSKQFAASWDEVAAVIELAGRPKEPVDLVGPHGYIHGWIYVGGPGLPSVAAHNAKLRSKGITPPTTAHPALTRKPPGVKPPAKTAAKAAAPARPAAKEPPAKASPAARTAPAAKAPAAPPAKPEPAKPAPGRRDDAANRRVAEAAMAKGKETLFHGTMHEFKPGDIIDAQHSNAEVAKLQEGKKYAFADTDPGEATFAGRAASAGGHVYRVEPVGDYEFDPHQGSTTSRRTTGGFRVVEEVKQWSGAKLDKPFSYKKKAYVRNGTIPAGMAKPASQSHSITRDDLSAVIALASSGGHHIAGTPDSYRHGWLKISGPQPRGVNADFKTADKMTKAELTEHLLGQHSGMPSVGRRTGPKNPSAGQLRAQHELMHRMQENGGAMGNSVADMGVAHTHGPGSTMQMARSWDELAAVIDLAWIADPSKAQWAAIDARAGHSGSTAGSAIRSYSATASPTGSQGHADQLHAIADEADRKFPSTRPGDDIRAAAGSFSQGDAEGAHRHLEDARMKLRNAAETKGQQSGRYGQAPAVGDSIALDNVLKNNKGRAQMMAQDQEDAARAAAKAAKKAAKAQDHAVTWDELAGVIGLSAETGRLAVTPAPYGKPGGPGLYHVKGLKHSDYLENIVHALMRKGMGKGKATAIARGSIRRWMIKSKHPEVRAAAGLAEGQEIAAQARAHAHATTWDELAAVIELGGPGSGQPGHTTAQPAGPGRPAGQGQPAPAAGPAPGAAKQTPAQAKQNLLNQAQTKRQQAAALTQQINAAQAVIAAAQAGVGKTVNAASNTTSAQSGSTTSTAGSTTASSAPPASSTASTPSSSSSTPSASSAPGTAAANPATTAAITQLQGQVQVWQGQVSTLLAQATALTTLANKMGT
jgi:hypothetical protein